MAKLQFEGCEDERLRRESCWAFGLSATKTNDYTEGRVRQNKSPRTQRTDCYLRAVKRNDNVESHDRSKEDSWDAMDGDAEGCNREKTSAHSGHTLI